MEALLRDGSGWACSHFVRERAPRQGGWVIEQDTALKGIAKRSKRMFDLPTRLKSGRRWTNSGPSVAKLRLSCTAELCVLNAGPVCGLLTF